MTFEQHPGGISPFYDRLGWKYSTKNTLPEACDHCPDYKDKRFSRAARRLALTLVPLFWTMNSDGQEIRIPASEDALATMKQVLHESEFGKSKSDARKPTIKFYEELGDILKNGAPKTLPGTGKPWIYIYTPGEGDSLDGKIHQDPRLKEAIANIVASGDLPNASRKARASEFRNCVAIGTGTSGYQMSGVAISPRAILTAGHFDARLGSESQTPKRVYQGTHHTAAFSNQVYSVTHHFRPSDYYWDDTKEITTKSDICLLILDRQLERFDPIKIAKASDLEAARGQLVTIVGFGMRRKTLLGVNSGYNLQETGSKFIGMTPLISEDSSDLLDAQYGARPGFEAIAGGYSGSCVGDSGGPLYIQAADGTLRLGGLTSRVVNGSNKACGDGSIYTLVYPHLDWIIEVIKDATGSVLNI